MICTEQYSPQGKLRGINVDVVIECPHCNGSRRIQHPGWKKYWDHWKDQGNELPYLTVWSWWRAEGYEYPPPEKIECSHCDYKGTITVRILELTQDELRKLVVTTETIP